MLQPADVNRNGISDAWEILHFQRLVSWWEDGDADGESNYAEYIAGSSPADAGSRFLLPSVDLMEGQPGLTWPVHRGREYAVWSADGVSGRVWTQRSPWSAPAPGTTVMQWREVNPVPGARFYRVDVRKP
jgi:hypothetical protein